MLLFNYCRECKHTVRSEDGRRCLHEVHGRNTECIYSWQECDMFAPYDMALRKEWTEIEIDGDCVTGVYQPLGLEVNIDKRTCMAFRKDGSEHDIKREMWHERPPGNWLREPKKRSG